MATMMYPSLTKSQSMRSKRKSAVELLAESKPFYVKSEIVRDTTQSIPTRLMMMGTSNPVSSNAGGYTTTGAVSYNRSKSVNVAGHHGGGGSNYYSSSRPTTMSQYMAVSPSRSLPPISHRRSVHLVPPSAGNNDMLQNKLRQLLVSCDATNMTASTNCGTVGSSTEEDLSVEQLAPLSPPAEYALITNSSSSSHGHRYYAGEQQGQQQHQQQQQQQQQHQQQQGQQQQRCHKSLPDLHCGGGGGGGGRGAEPSSNKSSNKSLSNRDSGGSSGHYTQRSEPPPPPPVIIKQDLRRDSGSSTQHSGNSSYYCCQEPECRAARQQQQQHHHQQLLLQQQQQQIITLNAQNPANLAYPPPLPLPLVVALPPPPQPGSTTTFKRQKCLRYKRDRPILRSKSDISDRYWRPLPPTPCSQQDLLPQQQINQHQQHQSQQQQPSSAANHLEQFFEHLGLTTDSYEEMLSNSRSSDNSPVFFSDVSTVDSSRPLDNNTDYGCHPYQQQQNQIGAVGMFLVNNNGGGGGVGGGRPSEPPSIVERNARIIKWLCNCRKSQLMTT